MNREIFYFLHVENKFWIKFLLKYLDPGCLTFSLPRIEVNVDTGIAKIEVKRINGKDGKVGCFWNTMEISAKANQHFVDTKGKVIRIKNQPWSLPWGILKSHDIRI